MKDRLRGADPRSTVEAYAQKCRSALYEPPDAAHPMTTRGAFALALMADFQNQADPDAFAIRTHENHLLGWVPRVYCADLLELRRRGQAINLTVEHVNPGAAPSWAGVMCRIEAPWPEGFRALAAPEYEPLAEAVG